MMKAAVIRRAGGPEVLGIEARPVPEPKDGEVLIRVRACGLNRSELFTRRGLSPGVAFPRVLGIEAVGTVVAAPGGALPAGAVVATAMGGMGRQFDGGYAEYACVPAKQVQVLRTDLPWDVLGALPEMLQTAWGSLNTALRLAPGESLLVRGGTTSVGLAAAAMAADAGVTVAATTRDPARTALLRENGAAQVFVDDGAIEAEVRAARPGGFDKVLGLVGTTTLLDSLRCASASGLVCMAGMVGDRWSIDRFCPMDAIPTGVRLTTYSGGAEDFMRTPLQHLVDQVAAGRLKPRLGPTFGLDGIADAHRLMEHNGAVGKVVVLP